MSKVIVQAKPESRVPVEQNTFCLRGYCEETIFETNFGPIPAKHLTTHHRLRAFGGGYIGIEWVRRIEFEACDLEQYPDLKPVLLKTDKLGVAAPYRNVLVSRSHHIWSDASTEVAGCFGSSMLWADKPDRFREQEFGFTYITFACERRAFVRAEGLWFAA